MAAEGIVPSPPFHVKKSDDYLKEEQDMEYKTLADMLWEAEEKREQVGRLTDT